MRFLILGLALIAGGCAPYSRPPASDPPPGPEPRKVSFLTNQGAGQGWFWSDEGGEWWKCPGVVVIHGDHGLTPRIREHARTLHDLRYHVLAVDLYRGEKVDSLLDAHIMDRGLPEERVKADLKGAVDYLLSRPGVKKDAIGVIGWDMGGGYALDAALADPRIRACVTCYGRLTTDAAALGKMNASVLAIMAGKDEGNPPDTLAAFRKAMAKAGKKLTLEVFQECDHGFMNPVAGAKPTPADEKACEAAWKRIEAFLAAELSRE
jgi:carboxymethylenebutenolidase